MSILHRCLFFFLILGLVLLRNVDDRMQEVEWFIVLDLHHTRVLY